MDKKSNELGRGGLPERVACPKCGVKNRTSGAVTLLIEMRPVLTEAVPAFPEALAEALVLGCFGCGYRMCMHYNVALDDNPELDLNEKLRSGRA